MSESAEKSQDDAKVNAENAAKPGLIARVSAIIGHGAGVFERLRHLTINTAVLFGVIVGGAASTSSPPKRVSS